MLIRGDRRNGARLKAFEPLPRLHGFAGADLFCDRVARVTLGNSSPIGCKENVQNITDFFFNIYC